MSELSLEEIERLAQLARLTLTDGEKEQFAGQLPKIVGFVDTLQSATLSSEAVEGINQSVDSLRDDEVSGTRLTVGQLEKLAPAWRKNQVVVPAVFEDKNAG
jgi:aspartyl-tRNA(Asn)/glutamyl-tRNA(Gln) amidotransferase subunit C